MFLPLLVGLVTTRRDLETGRPVELSMMLTTRLFQPVHEFGTRVIHASDEELSQLNSIDERQHRTNGLLDDVARSELTIDDVDHEASAWLASHLAKKNDQAILVGPLGVGLDRELIRHHMPRLSALLHDGAVDSSKVEIPRWARRTEPSGQVALNAANRSPKRAGRAATRVLVAQAAAASIPTSLRAALPR